ncbi:MAG: hypothetical protein KH268_13000 [Clostridiales bacterium]|nr:hypothetical protein [Clostridiales bacterium]
MSREKDEYIQLPPLRRDTDLEVLIALWEYMKMPDESQKVVLSTMKELNDGGEGGGLPPPEAYQSLPSETVEQFEKVMKNIIGNLIVEACDMACWVFKHKYVDGLTLEQMLDKNTGAEQYIIAMDILFDKYMEMTDEDYKNDIDHVEPS